METRVEETYVRSPRPPLSVLFLVLSFDFSEIHPQARLQTSKFQTPYTILRDTFFTPPAYNLVSRGLYLYKPVG